MRLRNRISLAARTAWRIARGRFEGAVRRQGKPIIPGALQDALRDYDPSNRESCQHISRYFAQNSGLVPRLVEIFQLYTVGSGLAVTPASSDGEWNKAALDYWLAWGQFADVSTRMSYGNLLSQVAGTWFRDGESFKFMTRGESGRPRLQLIESHKFATPPTERKREGFSVVDGVEIDPFTRRPSGYWTYDEDEKGKRRWRLLDATWVQHVFEPERPGQFRGFPFVSPVIEDLIGLATLDKYEMKAAEAASRIANVITTASGEISTDDIFASGGTVTTSGDQVTAQIETIGGDTVAFRDGTKFEQFKSDRPSVVMMAYLEAKERRICNGVGIPRVLVYPETMQGTQYRGALDMAAAGFRASFQTLADSCRRDWAWVIGYGIKTDPNLARNVPSDWMRCEIQSPAAPNVDQGYNSSAMLAQWEAGLLTLDDIYGPRGQNWRDQARRRAQQLQEVTEIADEFDVDAGSLLKATANAGVGSAGVQATALNGAQLASVQAVIVMLSQKQIAPEAAKRMLYIALPQTDQADIDAMVDASSDFTPTITETTQAPQLQPA